MTTLLRPSLPDMVIFDAHADYEITFDVFGGEQWTGYDIEIYNASTNVIHYSNSRETYSNRYNIQADTLANGNDYRFRVRTRTATEYSEFSDYMLIKVYAKPVCSIANLILEENDRYIYNQNHTFTGAYIQAEGVPMQSYYFVLYDGHQNKMQQFNTIYETDTTNIKQNIEGFEAETDYHIELVCTDKYGLQCSSGLVHFIASYTVPRIKQKLELENDSETASVKVSSNMIQIIFKSENDPVYINEQEIDLRNNKIWIDEQINLVSNFTIELYARAIPRIVVVPEEVLKTECNVLGQKVTALYDYIDYQREHIHDLTFAERKQELQRLRDEVNAQKEVVKELYDDFSDKQLQIMNGLNEYFCTIYSVDGSCDLGLFEYGNRIHALKIIRPSQHGEPIVSHYASEIIEDYIPNESPLKIQLNHVDRRLEVYAQIADMVS